MTGSTHPPFPTKPVWRLFIALPLPDAQRSAIAELVDRLAKAVRFTSCQPTWVHPESMHLTLAFLVNQPPEVASVAGAIIDRAAETIGPLQLEVKGIGVFPDWRAPKVLWTGVRERTHQLEALRERLISELSAALVNVDDKPFKPHLTLARFKSLKGTAAVEKIVASHREFFCSAQPIRDLVLYQSVLRPEGAHHSALHTATLRSTG